MTYCGISLSRSLFGVKRTWHIALQMSAYDPKLTSGLIRISGRLRAISHSPPVASARGLAVVQTALRGRMKRREFITIGGVVAALKT